MTGGSFTGSEQRGDAQRANGPMGSNRTMADVEREMQELKREVVEARNLVIKTDNLLKNLHADLKLVARKQETFERRSFVTSATALILFAALSAVGAYMFARSEIRGVSHQLVEATRTREAAEAALQQSRAAESEAVRAREQAFALYTRLGDETDREKQWAAVSEAAKVGPTHLSPLEQQALKDRASSLRRAAAEGALDAGRTAFSRGDHRQAAEELGRYFSLVQEPEETAYRLLGQARHAMRDYKNAIEPLQTFLEKAPNSKVADYVTLVLGESLAEAGERDKAIAVYRTGADKYYTSQWSSSMRVRAKRLESQ